MRRCKGKYYKDGNMIDFRVGKFHTWGLGNTDNGSYTVGIVELKDGTIITVSPEDLIFTDSIW